MRITLHPQKSQKHESKTMKIYSMYTTGKSENSLLDLKDPNGLILDHFMLGIESKNFKNGHPLNVTAQYFFTPETIKNYDYFEPTMAFPIFSDHAINSIGEVIRPQMATHPCRIKIGAHTFDAHAGIILNRKPVFERVDDYEIQIRKDIQITQDDLIIRDIDNPQFFFVTDTFKKMCQNHELNIKFQEFSLMK
ncbi:hypothetical protein [Chromobacterium sp. LK11]|uniref:hypothetical protein n=1 Tax=Chromobacterium sp. LK11 TaxID=1628212 RepID=UPI0012E18CB9|nr:hypothetical protein [Chromobacterium sp. LK11]